MRRRDLRRQFAKLKGSDSPCPCWSQLWFPTESLFGEFQPRPWTLQGIPSNSYRSPASHGPLSAGSWVLLGGGDWVLAIRIIALSRSLNSRHSQSGCPLLVAEHSTEQRLVRSNDRWDGRRYLVPVPVLCTLSPSSSRCHLRRYLSVDCGHRDQDSVTVFPRSGQNHLIASPYPLLPQSTDVRCCIAQVWPARLVCSPTGPRLSLVRLAVGAFFAWSENGEEKVIMRHEKHLSTGAGVGTCAEANGGLRGKTG